jgi:hypothetical protein
MKRQNIFIIGAIISITFGAYLLRHKLIGEKLTVASGEQYQQQSIKMLTKKVIPRPAAIERSIAAITTKELESFRSSLPDKVSVKSEVGENPHSTPKSLIKFAEKMGPLVEKSLQDSAAATLFIDELNDCALNESVPQSARALCLSNAEKLVGMNPQIKEKVEKIREQVPQEVINFVDNKKRLIKR